MGIYQKLYELVNNTKIRIDWVWSDCFDSELNFTPEQMSFIDESLQHVKRYIDQQLENIINE